jgi:hypothetical protein
MNADTVEDKPVKRARPRSNVTVAEYLTQQINLCGKTQSEIAREAGFGKPNIITMLKQGTTKVPTVKIGPLARALEVDPLHLFKLVMNEYEPDTWDMIQDMILKQPFVTRNEMEIIEVIRTSNVVNPKITTDEERHRLLDVVATFKPDNSTPT